ncbi:MAG TPA: outer membrane protein assembly factor BamD [Vicinamibacterales bacterium]|nr:outer membrane protein assembly factor BamD [Vicinamibacterales bacterium]
MRDTAARTGARLILAALLFGGCASMSDVTGVATQQDLMEVRTELAVIQRSASTAKADAEAAVAQMEKRQRERTAEDERRLQAIAQRLEGLSTGLTSLAGRLDELNTRTEALGRQMRGATAVPAPLPPTATARPTAPAPAPAPVEPTPGSRPSTNALQPQDIYQAAYIDFSKGSYPLAVAGFREFLRRYPDHPLAGAAQYWIGEAHFSVARGFTNAGQADKATEALEQAVQEFRKVQANFARSDKAATALYKEALALLELKQPAVAQARLQYLVDNFPQAEEAPLARERLAALKPSDR